MQSFPEACLPDRARNPYIVIDLEACSLGKEQPSNSVQLIFAIHPQTSYLIMHEFLISGSPTMRYTQVKINPDLQGQELRRAEEVLLPWFVFGKMVSLIDPSSDVKLSNVFEITLSRDMVAAMLDADEAWERSQASSTHLDLVEGLPLSRKLDITIQFGMV